MDVLAAFFSGAPLAIAIYQIAEQKIKSIQTRDAETQKRLRALRDEIAFNLGTLVQLERNDCSARAVYDPVQRTLLESLRCAELVHAGDDFDRLFKGKLKKDSSVKGPARILWEIKDVARKLKDLKDRLNQIPKKQAANARRILVMRRLPAIKLRLEKIDKVLSIIPLTPRGTKSKIPLKKSYSPRRG
jgi:hypothetical protein